MTKKGVLDTFHTHVVILWRFGVGMNKIMTPFFILFSILVMLGHSPISLVFEMKTLYIIHNVHTHAYIHTHIYIHTHTHTYTHTNIYTHIKHTYIYT